MLRCLIYKISLKGKYNTRQAEIYRQLFSNTLPSVVKIVVSIMGDPHFPEFPFHTGEK